MNIKGKKIGLEYKPFIVAEISANHGGSIDKVLKIVDAAAKAGVDAIKLQTYTADTITIKSNKKNFIISEKNSLWKNRSLHSLYKEAHTPWEWHKKIFDRAKKRKILCFSSPFDVTAVDFLSELDVPCFKIASSECIDIPLIEKVAKTNKPIIVSTGMATEEEINEAIKTIKKNGKSKYALMKCTASYPAKEEELNLATINYMRKKFKCEVGFSDHSISNVAAISSIAHGATFIEKHIVIKKNDQVLDAKFSADPNQFKDLVRDTYLAWLSIGKKKFGPTLSEKNSIKYRRSLYIVKEVKKGEMISKKNIRSIRPSGGLLPKNFKKVIGKKFKKSASIGTPLKWNLIK